MFIKEQFPDGTPIDEWFYDVSTPELEELGKQYILSEYGILDDGKIHTEEIQKVIDLASDNGGGVIVVPKGTYLTGSLFFKQGVNLYICQDGVLKGSDDISDYPITETRIEGEWCNYFSALINADGMDGFTMCGPGTIDGNGLRSWKAFWLRRKWNPKCTNKDEQRPRLVYISNCTNVTVCGLNMQNSHFWTNHIYKSKRVKYINCRIFSPASPVPSPSTDAIDIDVCSDFLVKNCYIEVNDDGVVLKGGRGPWADEMPENGKNERVLIEDCEFGFCHSCFTCGSESIHDHNIIFRNSKVHDAISLIRFKMRPDTPQRYEYIDINNISGSVRQFISIQPWTQFFDLKGRKDIPLSYANNIAIKNCECNCRIFFDVSSDKTQYILSDFCLERLKIKASESGFAYDKVDNISVNQVFVNDIEI